MCAIISMSYACSCVHAVLSVNVNVNQLITAQINRRISRNRFIRQLYLLLLTTFYLQE